MATTTTTTLLVSTSKGMPGTCQRLRLPSLVTVVRAPKPECSPVRRKEQSRVVMMGSARVGKSSIISQFLYDKYLARYRQTVEELHRGEYELPDGNALTLVSGSMAKTIAP